MSGLEKIVIIGMCSLGARDLYYNFSDKPKPPLFKVNPKTQTFFGQPTRLRPNRKWWQSKYY